MIPELDKEFKLALQAAGRGPVKVVHTGTNQVYFLIGGDQCDRLRPLFEADPLTEQEQLFALEQAGCPGAGGQTIRLG